MKKVILLAFLVVTMTLCLFGCASTEQDEVVLPAYTIESQEVYGIGEKNYSWRIIIEGEATDEELLLIFDELDDNKYDESTMWVYSSEEAVALGLYDVAMVERLGKEAPTITR